MPRSVTVSSILFLLAILFAPTSLAQFTALPNPGLPKLDFAATAWGDYDNDGYLDLAIAGYSDSLGTAVTRIYHNNHDGTFTDIGASLPGVYYCSLAWGDYDNDGYLDLMMAGTDNATIQETRLFHNNGDGTFTENTQTTFEAMGHGSISWGDYNNDGWLDFVICGYRANDAHIKLYKNNGDGSFSEETNASNLTPVNAYAKALWADFNNDGLQDLLIVGRSNGASTSDPKPVSKVFYNMGNGTFQEDASANLLGVWLCSAAVGDFNDDGLVDIALAGFYTPDSTGLANRDTTIIYRNNGDGTFSDIHAVIGSTHSSFMSWGDYNGDGKLDLVITGWTDGEGIYLNNGNSTFTRQSIELGWVAQGSATWGDFNNDGYLDLVMSGIGHATGRDTTAVYMNSGTGTTSSYSVNNVPSAPTNLASSVSGNQVTLYWTRGTDTETPTASLTYNLRVGTSAGGTQIMSPLSDGSTGFSRVVKCGALSQNSSWTIKNLAAGTYHWSVQSIDNAFAGSAFAGELTFTIVQSPLRAAVKTFLEGPFVSTGDTMSNTLRTGGTLAAHFSSAQIPALAVDSITIEIRDSTSSTASNVDLFAPAWLLTDGSIRAFTDSTKSYVEVSPAWPGNFYVIVHHRNHLAVMSSAPVALTTSSATVYDFSTAQAKAYGTNPMKALGAGSTAPYGLCTGDADGDGQVISTDFNIFNPKFVSAATGYQAPDWNLDGQVTSTDFNLFNANFTAARSTKVPK
jgi:hypothetical protein